MAHQRTVEKFISQELHNLLFLEEFVFAKNRFTPPSGTELELADAVVLLANAVLIAQIKERSQADAGDADAERKWFKKKVIKEATGQIRDTLGYLESIDPILVSNERGRTFNLATSKRADVLKLVIYQGARSLPADCRAMLCHVSQTAGFIHVIEASDYLEICRTLRVPEEVVRYLKHREDMLARFPSECAGLPEPALVGNFVGDPLGTVPSIESARHLFSLIDDEEDWNLAPFLRGLHDHVSAAGPADAYYDILIEFAKLPRSAWRVIKERIRLCVEKVQADEFARPYRLAYPDTGCGFVFVPVTRDVSGQADWHEVRRTAVTNFTLAHKYDQKLDKAVGILVAQDGEHFDIQWCLASFEWAEDLEMQTRLDENFPFRKVREAEIFGYHLAAETAS